jgi:hypothetical protein
MPGAGTSVPPLPGTERLIQWQLPGETPVHVQLVSLHAFSSQLLASLQDFLSCTRQLLGGRRTEHVHVHAPVVLLCLQVHPAACAHWPPPSLHRNTPLSSEQAWPSCAPPRQIPPSVFGPPGNASSGVRSEFAHPASMKSAAESINKDISATRVDIGGSSWHI